jgi:hypothetical protein
MILLLTAVVTTISLTMNERKIESPEVVSQSLNHIRAKTLSNEALRYALNQIVSNKIPVDQILYSQTFHDFTVLEGQIDSIQYFRPTLSDTLSVTAFVSANFGGKIRTYSSTALFRIEHGASYKAINCSKEVTMQGNAQVVGGIEENVSLNFDQIFGKTMAEMKAVATYYYKNPKTSISPISGITYVELSKNKTLHMSGQWSGDGILIVEGNFKDTGRANFEGVIWAEGGSFAMSGQSNVSGAIFVNTSDTVKLSGHTFVEYNETIVSNLINVGGSGSSDELEILIWDN